MERQFEAPSAREFALITEALAPWERYTRPTFVGMDRIPESGPLLFVGNHTLFGMLDVPLLYAEVYRRKGLFLRALGDHAHFKIPVWRDILSRFGTVDGTRDNCDRLMEQGEPILVFPGGGREVMKRKGERYKLLWKERRGFARMAIKHGYTIVPFAAVGADDHYEIRRDAGDLLASPLGKVLKRLNVRPEMIPPLVTGIGPTPFPRRTRYYFGFGEPISTAEYNGAFESDDAANTVRDLARAAVEQGLQELLARRGLES